MPWRLEKYDRYIHDHAPLVAPTFSIQNAGHQSYLCGGSGVINNIRCRPATTTAANGKLGNIAAQKWKCANRLGTGCWMETPVLMPISPKGGALPFWRRQRAWQPQRVRSGAVVDIFSALLRRQLGAPWVSFLPTCPCLRSSRVKGIGHFWSYARWCFQTGCRL